MDDDEYNPSIGEQVSFCEAYYLLEKLINTTEFSISDIGRGVFIAAMLKTIHFQALSRKQHHMYQFPEVPRLYSWALL